MEELLHVWLWVHRLVGYPTAFLIGPLAMLTFAGAPVHRRWGKLFVILMVFLYLTGTVMTFAHNPLGSWAFLRNIAFNLAGFTALLLGFRAIHRLRSGLVGPTPPADWLLTAALLAAALGMIAAGLRHFPMLVLGLGALILVCRDWVELRRPVVSGAILLQRHTRYMLISYFYVLTLVSLLHLRDMPQAIRWLWPWALGIPVLLLVAAGSTSPSGAAARTGRYSIWATVAAAMLLGGYVLLRALVEPATGPIASGSGTG